jgi:hypothetical protein
VILMLLIIHFHHYYLSMKINQLDCDDNQHVRHYDFYLLNNIYNIDLLNKTKTKNFFWNRFLVELTMTCVVSRTNTTTIFVTGPKSPCTWITFTFTIDTCLTYTTIRTTCGTCFIKSIRLWICKRDKSNEYEREMNDHWNR